MTTRLNSPPARLYRRDMAWPKKKVVRRTLDRSTARVSFGEKCSKSTRVAILAMDQVTQPRQFTLYGENGCSNTLEVRPGSIGIVSADCPDVSFGEKCSKSTRVAILASPSLMPGRGTRGGKAFSMAARARETCPDKICVQQGFLHDSRLPVTCLPNRIVITLEPSGEE